MKMNSLKFGPIVLIVFFIIMTFFCQLSPAAEAPIIRTDKDIYNQNEMINVHFSNSPGNDGDWISIVPAGSPATEVMDYKNMPKGMDKGILIFDPPAPGKYEARAYYDYGRKGYVVSGRYVFSVASNPAVDAAMDQRMERKIDPNNPLEASLPAGNGLVYIFREAFFISASFEVQIIANGKSVVYMHNSSYFPFQVPAGDVTFTSGAIRDHSPSRTSAFESLIEPKAILKIKPGYVYFLRMKMIPMPFWTLSLDHVPHQEGANIIESYKLNQIKR